MIRLLSIALTLFVLSGCGGFAYNYSKPGVSQQQMRQDHFECKQISRQQFIVGTGGMLVGGSEPTWETLKECLEARGYTITIADSEESNPSSRPAAATTPITFANIRNAEDMQKHLDSERQYLDRKVAAGQITQKEADLLHQGQKEFLAKRLSSLCVPSNVTIGTRVRRSQDGKMVKVTTLYGNSPRCSDSATPILVDVEEAGEGESSVSTSQSKQVSAEEQYNLGVQYANGNGVQQDYAKARQWYEQAAAQGNAEAQNSLGGIYADGQGVPQDYAKARQWYELAAAQGNALAQNNLGFLYNNGRGMPLDYAKARQWFEKAAAQKEAHAQDNLGTMYYWGHDVPQDYAKARQWWEQSAAQGYALAQNNLGVLYGNGQGVSQDYAKARQWYEQAAAQGYALAQHSLGFLYETGRGVPKDYATARKWYEESAAQGLARAQNNLGLLYANGLSVPQDYVRAYMWLSLAEARLTGNEQELALNGRDEVARRMTSAQIPEAQRLAQQCQAQQFKGC